MTRDDSFDETSFDANEEKKHQPLPLNDPDATAAQSPHEAEISSQFSRHNSIGPYRILKKIAEGGMGAVYLAEQSVPIRRLVALKVIKAGHDSKEIVTRFEAERQALALMDHPNIARVLDGGQTQDGAPYFAMELVNGVPLTTYCDKNKLTIQERLKLFIPVCKAVQHAHQKGIIHRDLKPSNVLVTLIDGEPTPKVIDFGLAKATEHRARLTDKSMSTEFGQVLGTIRYMSPEQAEMNQLDVDTRTDIYSLGVMLYELLTGSTPLDQHTLGQNALLKVLELIRDKEPPRPSTRLSDSGDHASSISEQRQIHASRLHQILRGELDWIVMKALEKDRSRRFDTANDFAEDIRRFLDNDPVLARPPSVGYKLRKTVGKHRLAFLTATGFLITVLLLLGWVTALFFEKSDLAEKQAKTVASETKAKQKAEQEVADQRATTDFLFSVFAAGDPLFSRVASQYGSADAQEPTVREVTLIATRAELDDASTAFPNRPKLRAKILGGLADNAMSCGALDTSTQAIQRALKLLPKTQENEVEIAKLNVSAAMHDYCYGEMRRAHQRLVWAQSILKTATEANPLDKQLERKYQDIPLVLGMVLLELDLLEESQEQFELMSRTPGHVPAATLRRLAGRIFALGVHNERLGRRELTKLHLLPMFGLLVIQLTAQSNELNENVVQALSAGIRSILFYQAGFKDRSVACLEEMLTALESSIGKDHILNTFPLFYISIALDSNQLTDEALLYNSRLLELIDRHLGVRNHPRLRQILTERGEILLKLWERSPARNADSALLTEAYQSVSEAIAIGKRALAEKHWQVGFAHYFRGKILRAQGRHEESLNDLETAYNLIRPVWGPNSFRATNCLRETAVTLEKLGRTKQAEEILRLRVASCSHPAQPRYRLGRAQLYLANHLWNFKATPLSNAARKEVHDLVLRSIGNLIPSFSKNRGFLRRAMEIRRELIAIRPDA